jgi:hypothetical protein
MPTNRVKDFHTSNDDGRRLRIEDEDVIADLQVGARTIRFETGKAVIQRESIGLIHNLEGLDSGSRAGMTKCEGT